MAWTFVTAFPLMQGSVRAQKVQDDAVGLGRTAGSSSGLVPKLYAALTVAFAGAGASYLLLSSETLTVRSQRAF